MELNEKRPRVRYGLFVCWSFSTFSNEEYTRNVKSLSFFNPTGFDPDSWASVAAAAGMDYILFLTKHHDGFCLWDTDTTDWKVTNSPLGVDVLAEVRSACDRHGLELALYFSEGDWLWPDSRDSARKKAQLEELLSSYGDIAFWWMDHAAGDGGMSHRETVDWIRNLQASSLIGFNHGTPAGDLRLGELGWPSPLSDISCLPYADQRSIDYPYKLAECAVPLIGMERWFYTKPEWDGRSLSYRHIQALRRDAAKYQNLLSINVGPDRAGRLRTIDRDVLLKANEMLAESENDRDAGTSET